MYSGDNAFNFCRLFLDALCSGTRWYSAVTGFLACLPPFGLGNGFYGGQKRSHENKGISKPLNNRKLKLIDGK